jgi:hypothetical protein
MAHDNARPDPDVLCDEFYICWVVAQCGMQGVPQLTLILSAARNQE